jgi:hypothetical protein
MVLLLHVERRWIGIFSPNLRINATPRVLKSPHEPCNFLASKHCSCIMTLSREVLRHSATEIAEVPGSIVNLKFQVLIDLVERQQLSIAHSLYCGRSNLSHSL